MNKLFRVMASGLLLSLVACASVPVDTTYKKDFSFRGLRTFDWLPQEMAEATGRAPADTRLDIVTKNALRKELTARFYRQQLLGMPDFWVSYRVGPLPRAKAGKDREPEPLDIIDPLETPQLGPSDLMLEIIDPRSQRVIWRGWGQNMVAVNGQPLAKKTVKAVDNAVQVILQSFPPR